MTMRVCPSAALVCDYANKNVQLCGGACATMPAGVCNSMPVHELLCQLECATPRSCKCDYADECVQLPQSYVSYYVDEGVHFHGPACAIMPIRLYNSVLMRVR